MAPLPGYCELLVDLCISEFRTFMFIHSTHLSFSLCHLVYLQYAIAVIIIGIIEIVGAILAFVFTDAIVSELTFHVKLLISPLTIMPPAR